MASTGLVGHCADEGRGVGSVAPGRLGSSHLLSHLTKSIKKALF